MLFLNADKLKKLKGLETLAMTTNGILLARKLPALKDAGLDLLNVSLDTLIPAKFEFITRRKGFDKVIQGIDLALEFGYKPLKVNILYMKAKIENLLIFVSTDELCGYARIE